MDMVRQHHDGIDRERVAPPDVPERRPQQFDIVGEQRQPAFGQIPREEIGASSNGVAAIGGHGHDGFALQ
jgi:hypothetical protein